MIDLDKIDALARQAAGAGTAAIPLVTGEQLVQAFPVAQQGGGELQQDERTEFAAWVSYDQHCIREQAERLARQINQETPP